MVTAKIAHLYCGALRNEIHVASLKGLQKTSEARGSHAFAEYCISFFMSVRFHLVC